MDPFMDLIYFCCREFVFPGRRPSAWLPALALALNLYLPALAPNLHLTALAPNLYLPTLAANLYLPAWPQIFIYRPWSVRSLGLHIPTLSPQFVFTGPELRFLLPCSEFTFTFLSIAVAVAVVILAIATFHTRKTGNW